MRWEALFRDLDDPWPQDADAELSEEVAARSQIEQGRLLLTDRLAANHGVTVQVSLVGQGGEAVTEGCLLDSGPDWLLLATPRGNTVVALAAVTSVRGLTPSTRPHEQAGLAEGRLDLRFALRRLAGECDRVTVRLTDGALRTGRLVRIAADFVELNEDGRTILLPTCAIAAARAG